MSRTAGFSGGLRKTLGIGTVAGTASQTAERLAHACSTVEEPPFRAVKPWESVPASAAVTTICRAGAFSAAVSEPDQVHGAPTGARHFQLDLSQTQKG